jgi:hypothetical protein
MRLPRILAEGEGYYHVMSRIIGRQMLLDDGEKERLIRTMRKCEAFSGCNVLGHTCMDNHFHWVLHVPQPREITDEELIERLGHLYAPIEVKAIAESLGRLRESDSSSYHKLRDRYISRMFNLSEFCKTAKQRITQSYNHRHSRKGTLWEDDRFKSVLIEGNGNALARVLAYVDLNAVRAGKVQDPKDYRFCSYAEAVAGGEIARRGIEKVMLSLHPPGSWRQIAAKYRNFLFQQGEATGLDEWGQPLHPGTDPEYMRQVIDDGGKLSATQVLHCKVRYFSDGVCLGSREFAENVYTRYRRHFSPKRKRGAAPMRGADWGGLCTLRRLQRGVISVGVAT